MTGVEAPRLAWLLVILLAAGCGPEATAPKDAGVAGRTTGAPTAGSLPEANSGQGPLEFMPTDDLPSGWRPTGSAESFDGDTLYDLEDGQAESYFAYGFEQVVVRTYEHPDGANLRSEIWQLATPADAFGLYSAHRAGTLVSIGNEGYADPGRRLSFWQDRYYVQLLALQDLHDADLAALAQVFSDALPSGGEQPEVAARLPQEGMVERSTIFFHEEISVQSYLWLGGENLLGLGPDTNGVLARYEMGSGAAQLLLIEYRDTASASSGLQALRAAQLAGLVEAQADANLLAAVFGAVDRAVADQLAAVALGNR